MADVAFRFDDRLPLRPFGRGRAAGRGGFDRLAPRSEPFGDRPRGEATGRPWPWPVVPARETHTEGTVVPSSTAPAVVALPRVATAAPSSAPQADVAPPIRVTASVRPVAPIDGRRRGFAVIAAAATHLLCLGALLAMPADEPSGGGVATEALEIAIVFAEDSVDAVAGAPASSTETPQEPAVENVPAETAPSPPVAVAEPVPDEPAAQPIASPPPPVEIPPVDSPAATETPVLATSLPADETVPPPVLPSPPPVPEMVTQVPVAPPPVTPPQTTRSKAEPKPTPKPARRETVKAKRPEVAPRRSAPAASTGSGPRDSLSGARSTGSAPAAGAGAHADWRAAVLAALARAKRYPDDARDRGLSGRAVVTFTLTRGGAVTGVALAASSGSAVLDGATLAMPRRAAFPPMPSGGPDIRTFTAGVRYDLR
jgi:protein TonB